MLVSLKIAKKLDIDNLKVFTDSQLISGQVKDDYESRDPTMVKYLQKMKDLILTFKYFNIFHIPRMKNAQADTLSRLTTTSFHLLGRTFIKYIEWLSIDNVDEVLQINDKPSWMDPIIQYLTNGILPGDLLEAKRLGG